MKMIDTYGKGAVVYLMNHEGRGIGIVNKDVNAPAAYRMCRYRAFYARFERRESTGSLDCEVEKLAVYRFKLNRYLAAVGEINRATVCRHTSEHWISPYNCYIICQILLL